VRRVSDQRHGDSLELAQGLQLARGFEDLLVEVPHAKLLGQGIRIALVALRTRLSMIPATTTSSTWGLSGSYNRAL
jgi:hypothetical protein